jgi:hypothetical protein
LDIFIPRFWLDASFEAVPGPAEGFYRGCRRPANGFINRRALTADAPLVFKANGWFWR